MDMVDLLALGEEKMNKYLYITALNDEMGVIEWSESTAVKKK